MKPSVVIMLGLDENAKIRRQDEHTGSWRTVSPAK